MITDPAMARYVLNELISSQLQIAEAMASGFPDLTEEEHAEFKHCVGFAIATVYTFLMIPIIKLHPELDPDRDQDAPRSERQNNQTRTTRTRFAERLTTASERASAHLDAIQEEIARRVDRETEGHFAREAERPRRHLQEMRSFAVKVAARDSEA